MKRLLFLALAIASTIIPMDNPMETQVKPIKVGTKRGPEEEMARPSKNYRADTSQIASQTISPIKSSPMTRLEKLKYARSMAPQRKDIALQDYYNPQQLEELYGKNKQRHAPILILLDPKNTEQHGALEDALAEGLEEMAYPMLVSTSLLHSLLASAIIEGQKNPNREITFTFQNWNICITPHSNFVILIPKKFSKMFPDLGLKISSNLDISNLLPGAQKGKEKIKDLTILHQDISDFPTPSNTQDFYSKFFRDFSRIFFTTKEVNALKLPIWDFFIIGHGSIGASPVIVGLPPAIINKMLHFFDTDLNTGTVFLQSCMLGGKNLNLLEFEEAGIPKSHPYLIIAGSITDMPTLSPFWGYKEYFNRVAQLGDKGNSINQLLISVSRSSPELQKKWAEELMSPNQNEGMAQKSDVLNILIRELPYIPQIWLPNGMGFQTFNIDQDVLVLGKVMAHVAAENKKPVSIKNKNVVLLYPSIVPAALAVFPSRPTNTIIPLSLAKETTFASLPMPTEAAFWKNFTPAKRNDLAQKINSSYPGIYQLYENEKTSLVFPQFVSMARGDTTQFIEAIMLDYRLLTSGVIRFIRDAFLDVAARETRKTFLIQQLAGYNDISLLLEASRIGKDIAQLHPLENYLLALKNKFLLLKKVIITTQHDETLNKEQFSVEFSFGNSAWSFTSDDILNLWPKTILWNFRNINFEAHEKQFDEIKQQLFAQKSQTLPQPGQKTISETLKKKQEAIEIRKARESKQKETAEQAIKKYKEIQRPQS